MVVVVATIMSLGDLQDKQNKCATISFAFIRPTPPPHLPNYLLHTLHRLKQIVAHDNILPSETIII